MKRFALIVILAIVSTNLFAAIPEYLTPNGSFLEHKSNSHRAAELDSYKKLLEYKTLSGDNQRNYDVLNYDLFMDWTSPLSSEPLSHNFNGINNIKLRITEDSVHSIVLDAKGLEITALYLGADAITFNQEIDGLLTIELPVIANTDDTLTFSIEYNYVHSEFAGFYLFKKGMYVGLVSTGDSVFTEERIAYTMSEPTDAHLWMPCNDNPSDKARSSISIRVPEGYTAVSNGLLISKVSENNSVYYNWADTSLISTYLMAATASIFETYSEWYKPENSQDSIELSYYVWAKDVDNELTDYTVYNAKNAFRGTAYMMDVYSNKYIPYPFAKYGQVAVQPFDFGGMEHQTITSVNRSWLRGRNESGIAHELSHHWLGDLVTCANWDNIWFNEGGATWSEAIWAESWGGEEGYLDWMNKVAGEYFRRPSIHQLPIYGIPSDYIFSTPVSYLVYNKASWVYHQLRIMLGDDVFFPAFRNLLTKYSFSNIDADQFQKHFEDEVPNPIIPFDIFFNEWLKQAGHPSYTMNSSARILENEKYLVEVRVNQIQSTENVPDLFVTYLPIVAYSGDKKYEHFVVNDSTEQSFTFEMDFLPDSVTIDTRKVLAEIIPAEVIVSVADNAIISSDLLSIAPSIASAGTNISILLNNAIVGEYSSIEIFDIMGRQIDTIYSGIINSSEYLTGYTIGNIPAGQYIVKFTNSKQTIVKKIIIQ